MTIPKKDNILVLGAGPSGLCAAWNLVKDGHRVIVFEKEPICGGQSITFEQDGFRYDLGPHNIHSHRPSVLEFLKRILNHKILETKVLPQIYFRQRRIQYPLVGIQVLESLPLLTSVACGLSFLWCRVCATFSSAFQDDGSYETWVVNRFGRQFYNIFFGPYTKKTWCIPPAELSDIIAQKRIAIRGISELISSIFFKKEIYHPENPRLVRSLYPIMGVGEISDYFAAGIREGGGTILTRCAVKKIVLDGKQVTKIFYSEDGKLKTLDFPTEGGAENWQVFSTIPINEMILMVDGNVPQSVQEAAMGLDFTSEVFLYLNLNIPDAFKVPLLYFSEDEFPFNRIYDVGFFSRAMVPEGKNALCLELTCNYGDEIWNMEEDALFQKCMLPLEKHKLLNRDSVTTYHLSRLSHAYPRFRVGYKEKLRTIFNYLADVPNLITFGRQGLFSYANVDDVIWMAFEVIKELPYRERIRLPIEELLPDYINF